MYIFYHQEINENDEKWEQKVELFVLPNNVGYSLEWNFKEYLNEGQHLVETNLHGCYNGSRPLDEQSLAGVKTYVTGSRRTHMVRWWLLPGEATTAEAVEINHGAHSAVVAPSTEWLDATTLRFRSGAWWTATVHCPNEGVADELRTALGSYEDRWTQFGPSDSLWPAVEKAGAATC